MAMNGGKISGKPRMGPLKPKQKPQITRIKTVWVTKQTEPFPEHYQVGSQIGEPGQFGKAFRCKRRADKKIFAVKCISKARFYRLDRSAAKRQSLLVAMQGEIDIMRRLNHKYIVNMETVFEDKHTLYIVMEECKGGELFDRIRAKTRYPEPLAAPIIRMMLDALFYMHEYNRVVHCDLKPDNVLFVTPEEDSPIKIIDFGMSKVLPRLRSLRELCGTPYYTAPEIIRGEYAHAADMWSVGVILFVMLFGFPPFYVDPAKFYGQEEAKAIYKLIQKGFSPEVKKGYGPWFPKKMPVSSDARDFIMHLLEMDEGKRFSAREALNHDWIKYGGQKPEAKVVPASPVIQTPVEDEKGVDLQEGFMFANFGNAHKFKFAVSALFKDKYVQMRPKHFENLKKLYHTMDKDQDGKIDFEEFKNGMMQAQDFNISEEHIKEIFQELDVKNVGAIDFEALLNAAVHDYLVANDQRLYEAFRELDKNEVGSIQLSELKTKLHDLGQDQLQKFIELVDTNKDGTIDYEEFLRAIHPNYHETPQWFLDGSNIPDSKDKDDQKNGK